jgi:hypothetical protein
MTDSAKLPALAVTDRWMRGVAYTRTFALFEPDNTALDLSNWANLEAKISGSTGASQLIAARIDAATAAQGYLTVFAPQTALELDWPQRGLGPRNQLLISVRGTLQAVQYPLLQLRLTVEDSALA